MSESKLSILLDKDTAAPDITFSLVTYGSSRTATLLCGARWFLIGWFGFCPR